MVVEDDPEVRDLLEALLKGEGHRVTTARDGLSALNLLSEGGIRPNVILADYNLPNGMTGLDVIGKIRDNLHHVIPAIVLTGDISTETLREVALHDCVHLNKPVKLLKLAQLIEDMLPASRSRMAAASGDADIILDRKKPTIFIVDDSMLVREGLRDVLEDDGRTVKVFASSEDFLEDHDPLARDASWSTPIFLASAGWNCCGVFTLAVTRSRRS